jgi:flagellar protein FliO/FliZ
MISMPGLDHMVSALIVVLAAIAVAAVLLRRFAATPQRAQGLMKNLASLPLGPRERVVLLEFGDTWLLLGVTSQGVTCLHTLPKGELPAGGPGGRLDFAALLARTVKQRAT